MKKKQKDKVLKNVSDLKIFEARQHIARLYLYISVISIASIVIFKMAIVAPVQFNSVAAILLTILFSLLAVASLVASFVITLNNKK